MDAILSNDGFNSAVNFISFIAGIFVALGILAAAGLAIAAITALIFGGIPELLSKLAQSRREKRNGD